MRYANSKHSHQGIGVEPKLQAGLIELRATRGGPSLAIMDKEQAQQLIDLLQDACEILEWKSPKEPSHAFNLGVSTGWRDAIELAANVADRAGVMPEMNVADGGPEWYRHSKRIARDIRALVNARSAV